MWIITLTLLIIFVIFQCLYNLIPLFMVKNNREIKKEKEEKISILIPAFNEEKTILNCLRGILNVDYVNFEAIFINDGSKDNTFSQLDKHLDLRLVEKIPASKLLHEKVLGYYQSISYPNIYVIDKVNGGKADALNAGIEYAENEIIITLDADSILDTNSLHVINSTFKDDTILAVGGMVQISQGFYGDSNNPQPTFKTNGLIKYQILQYLTAFYLYKLTQSKLKSITVIAGAFGAFKKNILFEVGGYRKTVGEDMDITLKIQILIKTKYKRHKIVFQPYASCYTECPSSIRDIFSQRIRWQKAFIDCVFIYRKAFFRKLTFSTSLYFLVDSLLFGTIKGIQSLCIPIALLLVGDGFSIPIGLFTLTYFMFLYQGITTLVVSRRFGIIYSKGDYLRFTLFIPLELITYRLLGLLFVTFGTILFFKNKDSWNVTRRVGINNQTYARELS